VPGRFVALLEFYRPQRPLLITWSDAQVITGFSPEWALGSVNFEGYVHLLGEDYGFVPEGAKPLIVEMFECFVRSHNRLLLELTPFVVSGFGARQMGATYPDLS
jgi:hypothetical protein